MSGSGHLLCSVAGRGRLLLSHRENLHVCYIWPVIAVIDQDDLGGNEMRMPHLWSLARECDLAGRLCVAIVYPVLVVWYVINSELTLSALLPATQVTCGGILCISGVLVFGRFDKSRRSDRSHWESIRKHDSNTRSCRVLQMLLVLPSFGDQHMVKEI